MRGVYAALILLTGVNVTYRVQQWYGGRGAAMAVSGRSVPFLVPELQAEEADDPCRILVFFRASCPYCKEAARIEASRDHLPLPITWVAETRGDADVFADSIHEEGRVVYGESAFRDFKIMGVPAGLLVRDDSVVMAWRYQGTERREDLELACGPSAGR